MQDQIMFFQFGIQMMLTFLQLDLSVTFLDHLFWKEKYLQKEFNSKNISLVINREHVKDKPDSMNNSFDYLKNNNWLNINSSFRIEFLGKVFDEQIIGYYSNGKSYKNPFINDFIINQTISDLASSLPILQDLKNHFLNLDLKILIKIFLVFFESQFSLKFFQYLISKG